MRKKGWIGLGVIARDREGFCLGACSISKQEQVDPKMAETMAALQAIIFSKEAGFMEVIFEGDAAQGAKEIMTRQPSLAKNGHFIESIHQEMGNFCYAVFQATLRECNSAAHSLAKEASQNFTDSYWLEETPRSISNIVFREASGPYILFLESF
jgi:hypothetical protein